MIARGVLRAQAPYNAHHAGAIGIAWAQCGLPPGNMQLDRPSGRDARAAIAQRAMRTQTLGGIRENRYFAEEMNILRTLGFTVVACRDTWALHDVHELAPPGA